MAPRSGLLPGVTHHDKKPKDHPMEGTDAYYAQQERDQKINAFGRMDEDRSQEVFGRSEPDFPDKNNVGFERGRGQPDLGGGISEGNETPEGDEDI